MSQQALLKLLNSTLEEIKGNAAFARAESNKQPHEWTVSRRNIKAEIFQQLNSKNYLVNGTITTEMREIVTEGVDKLVNAVWEEGKRLKAKNEAFLTGRKDGIFSIVVIVAQDIVKYRTEGSGANRNIIKYHASSDDIFNSIKQLYRPYLRDIRSNLNAYFKENSDVRKSLIPARNVRAKKDSNGNVISKGRQADTLLQLGHDELDSVAEQRISAGRARIAQEAKQIDVPGDLAEVQRFLRAHGFDVSLEKSGTEKQTIIKVKLQSQFINQGAQAQEEKNLVKTFKADLEKAINSVLAQDYLLSEGSDSRVDVEKKRIIKKAKKGLKPSKKVKAKFDNDKIDLKKSKANKKVKRGNTRKTVRADTSTGFLLPSANSSKSKTARPTRPPQQSYFSLIPIINRALPDVVRKNMGEPGLVNRTGRFAQSVRVEEIITTRKGFPSIGYTYQRNPYQIFETGAGKTPWANNERDPRKVIDQSVREIVQGLIQERFYTRRI